MAASRASQIFTEIADSASETLREASVGTGTLVGSITNHFHLNSGDSEYTDILGEQFNLIAPENACKLMQIGTISGNKTDFSRCDEAVNFAETHGQHFKFHNIIWAKTQNTPDWIYEGKTTDELENWMYSYVDQIHERYNGQLDLIDVINEMIADTKDDTYHESPWLGIDDFACKLFKYTRSKFPDTTLLYNDYSFESQSHNQPKSDKVYRFVKSLVDKDCGIDGVGFQSHYIVPNLVNEAFLEGIRKNIKRYVDLGLRIHFSEISNKCQVQSHQSQNCIYRWNETSLAQQSQGFVNLLDICLSEEACDSFQFWGFTDKYSFLKGNLNGMPWNNEMRQKPAVAMMIDKLDKINNRTEAVDSYIAEVLALMGHEEDEYQLLSLKNLYESTEDAEIDENHVEVQAGKLLLIEGEENVSTGYRWMVTNNNCDDEVILLEDFETAQEGEEKQNQLFGSATEANFAFQTAHVNSGACSIEFTLCRPWACEEDNWADQRTVAINLV